MATAQRAKSGLLRNLIWIGDFCMHEHGSVRNAAVVDSAISKFHGRTAGTDRAVRYAPARHSGDYRKGRAAENDSATNCVPGGSARARLTLLITAFRQGQGPIV